MAEETSLGAGADGCLPPQPGCSSRGLSHGQEAPRHMGGVLYGKHFGGRVSQRLPTENHHNRKQQSAGPQANSYVGAVFRVLVCPCHKAGKLPEASERCSCTCCSPRAAAPCGPGPGAQPRPQMCFCLEEHHLTSLDSAAPGGAGAGEPRPQAQPSALRGASLATLADDPAKPPEASVSAVTGLSNVS